MQKSRSWLFSFTGKAVLPVLCGVVLLLLVLSYQNANRAEVQNPENRFDIASRLSRSSDAPGLIAEPQPELQNRTNINISGASRSSYLKHVDDRQRANSPETILSERVFYVMEEARELLL